VVCRVFPIPDQQLYYFSFEALIQDTGKSSGNRNEKAPEVLYLLRDFQISYSPSASILVMLKGEGVVGPTRAFINAGAASVVASLWKVDDHSTSLFMGSFYRALKTGNST